MPTPQLEQELPEMIITDTHTHVWLAHADQDRRELREALDQVPLRRLYASGLHGHCPTPETVVDINNAVLELMRADTRVRGQLYLNPQHGPHALEELKRCRDLGFVMVKLWQATKADDPQNDPIYEMCLQFGMPVLLHCFTEFPGATPGQTPPEHIARVAARFPELTIQMAHMGGNFIRGIDAALPYPNICVDPSGSYGERGMIDYAVHHLGAERVLFGSDMPGSDVYHNLGKILGANLSDDQRQAILWKNAERLLP